MLAALALIGTLSAPAVAGASRRPDAWTLQGTLTASNAAPGDDFGQVVVISSSGTTAFVGAQGRDERGQQVVGAVFVFVKVGGGWVQQKELTSSDGAVGDYFGSSIATSKDGSTVVIGAPSKVSAGVPNSGAAYVFTRKGTTWTQRAELTGSPPGPGNYFGSEVAVNGTGTIAAVAAPGKNVAKVRQAGAVYVFKRSGKAWAPNAFLTDPQPRVRDFFGWALAVKETQVLASTPYHVNADGSEGVVYGFEAPEGTYVLQTTLTAADGKPGDQFGESLDVSIATMVIGATGHIGPTGGGAVYVYTHSDTTGIWRSRAELYPSGGVPGDDFGVNVSISGTTLAVADTEQAVGANARQGVVYVFTGATTSWTQQAELTPVDGGPSTQFGQSVAASSTEVMAGEPQHSVNGLPGAGLVDRFGSA